MLRHSFFLSALIFAAPLLSLNWSTDIEKASEQAKSQNKPMLVYFSGSWCIWCERLDTTFLDKDEFAPIAHEMILVKLEYPHNMSDYSSKQTELKKKYKVFSFPTLIVLSPSGQILGSLGYPRDSLIEYMAKIRAFAQIKMVQEKAKEEESTPSTIPAKASATTPLKKAAGTKTSPKETSAKDSTAEANNPKASKHTSKQAPPQHTAPPVKPVPNTQTPTTKNTKKNTN